MIRYHRIEAVREGRNQYRRPKLNRKLTSAADVYDHLSEYRHCDKEHFIAITLDSASRVIATRVVSIGTINQSLVHPREVFVDAITDRAAGIIVAHNHPANQLSSSREDERVTQRLKEAGKLLGIGLLDHVILTHEGYYSFQEEGLL